MIKDKVKTIMKSDKFIITLGVIAGLLLLANLWFSSYTFLKKDNLVKRDIERIEKVEDKLLQLEDEIKQMKTQEVK